MTKEVRRKTRTFLFIAITKFIISSYYSNYIMIYRLSLLFFIVVIVGMVSCKNNDEVFATPLPTYVNVVNASGDILNFYLNGTRQNNSSSLYPGNQSFYLVVPAGTDNFQFKKAGDFNVLFSVPLTLKDSVNTTLYVSGESTSNTFHTVDFLDTTNIINLPQMRIRFVNASSDAGALNAFVDSTSYSAVPYQTTSNFTLMGDGPKEIKIYQAKSDSLLKDTTIIFQPAHIYTLFSRGLIKGKGAAAFNIGLAINY